MLEKILTDLKHYRYYIVAIVLLALLVFLVYGSDLQIIVNEALQGEELSHVLILPFFVAILLYSEKDTIKAVHDLETSKNAKTKYVEQLVGVAVVLIAFLTYWYGSQTFYALNYHLLSLPTFLVGVSLILTGVKTTLRLLPPILFLFFIVPIPTPTLFAIGGTLANLNTQTAYALLRAFNIPVQLTTNYGPPTLILTTTQTAQTPFAVDLPCSGIYSLISFAMFATFLLLIAKGSIIKRIALVTIGAILFEVLNVLRITTVIGVAYKLGEQVAMTFVHSAMGLLFVLLGIMLTLGIADKFLKIRLFPTKTLSASCSECENSLRNLQTFCTLCGSRLKNTRLNVSRETFAKLLLLVLLSFMITLVISAPTFHMAQGLEAIAHTETGTQSIDVFPNITGYLPITFLYRDYDYEKLARQDMSLWYAYYTSSDDLPTIYIDVAVSGSISNLHNWEVCSYGWQIAQGTQPLVSVLDSRDVQLTQEVPIVAHFFTFLSPYNYTQITLYWYETAGFTIGATVQQRYMRVSLIALTDNSMKYQQLEDHIQPIGAALAAYWQPVRDNRLITMGIPSMQTMLVLSVVVAASAGTGQILADQKRKAINQKLFYHQATQQEKTVMQTIQKLAEQKETARTVDIQRTLAKSKAYKINFETLPTMLRNLEQYGFVKKEVRTFNNRPCLAWKNTLVYEPSHMMTYRARQRHA